MYNPEYRLSPEDERKIRTAMQEAVDKWTSAEGVEASWGDLPTLERIGAHSIGCALHDLREEERKFVLRWAYASIGIDASDLD